MRQTIYGGLVRLPSKLLSGAVTTIGAIGTIWPERLKAWIGIGMTPEHIRYVGIALLIAAVIYFVLLWLLKPSGDPSSSPSASQITHGDKSPAIGTIHGNPVFNYAPPAPPITQKRKDPYGARSPQKGWTEDGVNNLHRAISGYQPKPDFPLSGVLVGVYKSLGGLPKERHLRDGFLRKVDLTIADAIVESSLSVWGRVQDRPRQRISMASLRACRFLHVWKYLEVPTDNVRPTRYTDLMFNKEEVLEVWPDE